MQTVTKLQISKSVHSQVPVHSPSPRNPTFFQKSVCHFFFSGVWIGGGAALLALCALSFTFNPMTQSKKIMHFQNIIIAKTCSPLNDARKDDAPFKESTLTQAFLMYTGRHHVHQALLFSEM